MVHGPCGNLNPSAPCMQNGRCMKDFSKAFQNRTTSTNDGYPLYVHTNDGCSFPVNVGGRGSVLIDNSWIVPYNPFISAKFDCHTNVESVATFRTIKYCFKYVHKGPDRATLEYNRDEIKQYIDSQYIGAPEGIWCILHFDMHKHIPSIERLQVFSYLITYLHSLMPFSQRSIFQANTWSFSIPINLSRLFIPGHLRSIQL